MQKIYKPQDLSLPPFARLCADSKPPFFAVFGQPIEHSLSPFMQNAAIAEIAKTDTSYAGSKYFAFEVDPYNLAEVLELFEGKNFLGINLTIPHKEVVMKIVKDFDESATFANACNTLLRTKDGWRGFNTDGFGLSAAVENAFGRKFNGADVVLLGAGGAARGAAALAAKSTCRSLIVANRSPNRLAEFAKDFAARGVKMEAMPLDGIEKQIPKGAIVINSTSVGLGEFDEPVIDFSKVPEDCAFFDMPYRRSGETASVKAARTFDIPAENGLAMLAWQGAKSLSIWTGKPLYGSLMLETLKHRLYGHL